MSLIYDNTRNSSDLFYKTGFKVPDPVIFFEIRNKKYLVLNDLEFQRGSSQAKVDKVISLREISNLAKSHNVIDIIKELVKLYNIDEVKVPYTFPSYLFDQLRKSKIKIEASSAVIFYKSRLIKSSSEVKSIKKTMK